MASPQPVWEPGFVLPAHLPARYAGDTLRQVARLSVGGSRLRVVLSNEYGRQPLRIGAARLARAADASAIDPATDRPLRFAGSEAVLIPPGGRAVSDPVELALPALARVAVSLYLPEPSAPAGFHWGALETAYQVPGRHVEAPRLAGATESPVRVFLSGLLVETAQPAAAVVALGDSITDGVGATPGADRRWPDVLAERLHSRGVASLNAGIAGARLLRDGMGVNAAARLARDVFSVPGLRSVIVLLGTNDLGWPGGPFAPQDRPVPPQELIDGLRQLIAQARAHNVRIVGATLTPFEGALQGTPLEGHYSPGKERARQAVNAWIRDSGEFDAVIDFDRILRDPARPARLRADLDSGDHLHPGDAGYRAMAEGIDLDLLLGRR